MEDNKPKPHPTEDVQLKDKIEIIRNMGTSRQARALILLVLLDEKPVSVFNIKEDQVAEVLSKCKSIGLSILTTKEEESDEYGKYQMAVSKSRDFVNEIYEIIQKDTKELDHRRFGELMGFPKTAINTFLEKDESKHINLDEYLETTEEYRDLFGFMISKDHSEEEKSVLNKWHNLILKYSPELLKSFNKE